MEDAELSFKDNAVLILTAMPVHRSSQHSGRQDLLEQSHQSAGTRSGRWVVLHGVPLAAVDNQRVAVIVEPAHPSRIAALLMSAHGLTPRELQLTRLVLQGFSTIDIAEHF